MVHDPLQASLFGGIRQLHPLLGSTPPAPLWLPSDFEGGIWPRLDDPEAFRVWLDDAIRSRSNAPAVEELRQWVKDGACLSGALEGIDLPDVRDAFRLARHFADKHARRDLPREPERRFLWPHDSADALRALHDIRAWLERAIRDGGLNAEGKAAGSKRKRGRPKRNYETIQREAEIAARWRRAREAGACKSEWAREHGLTVKELDQLLDRVRKYDQPRKKSLGK
jgi:hypothetical protein